MTMDGTKIEPAEIQHVRLRRRPFGYRRKDVDQLLETVTAGFEDVWFERNALREQVEQLQADLAHSRGRDRLVGSVMRNAQQIAAETVAEARATAEVMLAKARRRADELVAEAQREPERLREEIRTLTSIEAVLHERFRAFVSVAGDVLDPRLQTDAADGDGSPETLTHRRGAPSRRT
jgi:cell division initiation protein